MHYFLEEEKPLGTIGALGLLKPIVGDIIVTNCDIIIKADYNDILNFHKSNNNDLTIVAAMKHMNLPYGVCNIENGGDLVNITEKPEFDFLVSTGMYMINHNLLKYIPKNEFFHATHFIEKIKKENKKVGVYPISENSWMDVGE